MKYFYLYNDKIWWTHYKMPEKNIIFPKSIGLGYDLISYNKWLSSLQECKIDSDNFDKIIINIPDILLENGIIEVTDIVNFDEINMVITFKNNDMELSALQKHRKTWVGKSDEWLFERLNNELKSKIETIHDLLNQIDTNNSTHAINFTEWVCDNWIKDPFPRKEFDDDIIRYTNVGSIDGEEELKIYTIKELYEIFCIEVLGIKSKEKYEGKMWKTSDDKITWHLHWWSESDNPDKCKGNVREIKIKD